MSVWILFGLFTFLVLQTILLVVWYFLFKRRKLRRKSSQEIAAEKYIQHLEKRIDIEYYI